MSFDTSIVMGTKNRLSILKKTLPAARASVKPYTHHFFVVDGGSTDGSLKYLHDQPDVTVIEQGRLLGATRAYNAGFRLAGSDLVTEINDDDEAIGSCIADGITYMRAHPECGQVAFAFDLWKPGTFRFDHVFDHTYVNKGITRRELGDRAGWWDEQFRTYAADCELSCRIWEMGYEVVELPECCVRDLKVRDELYKINNPTGRPNPDSTKFYQQRKVLDLSPPSPRRILHVALNTPRDRQPALERALRSLGEYRQIDWQSTIDFQNVLLRECEEFDPTLVFMQLQTPGVLDVAAARRMRKDGRAVVSWSGDVRTPMPNWYAELGKEIDLTLFTNEEWVEKLRKKGINADYLQIGFNQEIYHPWGDAEGLIDKDIVFLGNHYGDRAFPLSKFRIDIICALKDRYGKRFGIWGHGFPYSEGVTDHEQEARVYRSAKIAIGINQINLQRYTSDRLFRAMACGPLYLAHKYPGLEEDFEPGGNLEYFEGIKDLVNRIEEYLANDNACKRVANDGMELVHHDHTWLDRARQLSDMIGWRKWK